MKSVLCLLVLSWVFFVCFCWWWRWCFFNPKQQQILFWFGLFFSDFWFVCVHGNNHLYCNEREQTVKTLKSICLTELLADCLTNSRRTSLYLWSHFLVFYTQVLVVSWLLQKRTLNSLYWLHYVREAIYCNMSPSSVASGLVLLISMWMSMIYMRRCLFKVNSQSSFHCYLKIGIQGHVGYYKISLQYKYYFAMCFILFVVF